MCEGGFTSGSVSFTLDRVKLTLEEVDAENKGMGSDED